MKKHPPALKTYREGSPLTRSPKKGQGQKCVDALATGVATKSSTSPALPNRMSTPSTLLLGDVKKLDPPNKRRKLYSHANSFEEEPVHRNLVPTNNVRMERNSSNECNLHFPHFLEAIISSQKEESSISLEEVVNDDSPLQNDEVMLLVTFFPIFHCLL